MSKKIDSGVGWINEYPSTWKLDRLQWHIYEINKKNNPIITTNILSLTNKKGVIPYEEKGAQGNTSKENYNEYKIAFKDTIIANSMNILIGSVGYSNYTGCVSPVYYVFKEKKGNNLKFFNYIMQTNQFQKELKKYAKGILEIRLRLSSDDILKRVVPVPNEETQNKIVNYLDEKCNEIDLLINDIEEQVQKLDEYKKSIITNMVTKGLDSGFEMKKSKIDWLSEIPKHWDETRIGYKSWIRARLGWKGLTADEYVESGYPFLSAFNIQNDKLDWSELNYINQFRFDESPEIKLKKGDIILVKDGAGIGKCARIDELPFGESTTNGSLAVISTKEGLDHRYLFYYLLSSLFQNYIIRLINGMGVPHLSQEEMRKICIPLPPINEQVAIADYLDKFCLSIDSIIFDKKKQLEILNEYKKSLIYEYVTGKKEVL